MKRNSLTVLVLVLCALFCVPSASAKPDKQVVVLSCDLHCKGCCDKIMKNIAYEKGVKDIECNLKTKTVTVTYDADKTSVEALLAAFERIGKPAKVKNNPENVPKKAKKQEK